MATGLTKAVIVLVCINILLYSGGFRVMAPISDDNTKAVNQFVYQNATTGNWKVQSDFSSKLPSGNSPIVASITGFIDGLGTIGSAIIFLINIVFTPLALFTSMGLPADAVLILGLPLMIMLFLGVAYFIRSGF